MISFDIKVMYPSLPKQEVIREVERRIDNENFTPSIKKEALKKLVNLSVTYSNFKIQNNYYEQKDGLFIGSPTSPAFAEIYIQRLEEISIYRMIHAPRLWLRKVDDTFTITKSNIEDTLMELNKIHPKIEFTAEQEEEGKIAFLDCTIYRNENKLETKVFKKATHTG